MPSKNSSLAAGRQISRRFPPPHMLSRNPSKRVFVAVMAPWGLKREVLAWRQGRAGLPARWLAAEGLHLTLVPPWQESRVGAVLENLQKAAFKTGPFVLRFRRVMPGPDPAKPRLLWAVGEQSPALAALRQEVLSLLGRQPEERPFFPHMTLARLDPVSLSGIEPGLFNSPVDWEMKAESAVLLQSFLSPSGASYKKLGQARLLP